MSNIKSNKELVKLLKDGDMIAFDTIYNKYSHRLHKFVLRYLKQTNDADDIVQEVFIKVWEARSNIDIYASFESFLFTITYNSTISLLRKRLSEKRSKEYLKSLQSIESTTNVIDELHFKELSGQIKILIDQLTPRQKEIYILSREQGLSHKEISEKLNISENTIKNHLVAVLKFLRQNIDTSISVNAFFLYLFS